MKQKINTNKIKNKYLKQILSSIRYTRKNNKELSQSVHE